MSNIITHFAKGVSTVDPVDGGGGEDLQNAVIPIINAIVGVLGIICVIVVLIGGINYMTSTGDPAKVKKAKDTILYGVIGLIICALSFAIVNFVIAKVIEPAEKTVEASTYNGKEAECLKAHYKYNKDTGVCSAS